MCFIAEYSQRKHDLTFPKSRRSELCIANNAWS